MKCSGVSGVSMTSNGGSMSLAFSRWNRLPVGGYAMSCFVNITTLFSSSRHLSFPCNDRHVFASSYRHTPFRELHNSQGGSYCDTNCLHSVSSRGGPRSCILHDCFVVATLQITMSPSCSPVTAVVLAVQITDHVRALLVLKEFSER